MKQHPVSLLCVAAPADSALLDQWEVHLLPLTQAGVVTVRSEHHLQAGANRKEELFAHLEQAACLVLLLSADFFANDECFTLMERGLQRQLAGKVVIIPLLVRPVAWQDSPLATLPCLPANGVPITSWEHPDEGWLNAVQGVRRLLGRAGLASSELLPVSKRATSDRERMVRLLHRTYQTTLDDSLQGFAWIALGLTERPDAVCNATHLLQRLPDGAERALPAGTSILWVYDQAEEELLILGVPGAGKSTLLLDLALRLIARAEADSTHPLPVIVPLSSWAESRARVADWLVEQLARIYYVPRKLAQAWVEQGQVLPLLDGLDEMEEAARPLCIAAINSYRTERMTPLVICSRQTEYDVAATRERLLLQNAVVVQALTQDQVAQAIRQGGEALAGLRGTFTENPTLRELATTPLMLSVLMLAYRGTSIGDLPQQQTQLEERVWTDYVERMVRQKGADRNARAGLPVKRYSLTQTYSWLGWLAQQMHAHNQAIFYLEQLQLDWLPKERRFLSRWSVILSSGLIFGLTFGLLGQIFGQLAFGEAFGLVSGVIFGLTFGLFGKQNARVRPVEAFAWSWRKALFGIFVGGLAALLYGLLSAL